MSDLLIEPSLGEVLRELAEIKRMLAALQPDAKRKAATKDRFPSWPVPARQRLYDAWVAQTGDKPTFHAFCGLAGPEVLRGGDPVAVTDTMIRAIPWYVAGRYARGLREFLRTWAMWAKAATIADPWEREAFIETIR